MQNTKVFFTAFTLTACVLGLGVGLLTVGYNSRRIATGNTTDTAYTVEDGVLKLHTDSQTFQTPAPADIPAVVPAPLRGTAYFLNALTRAAENLLGLTDTV